MIFFKNCKNISSRNQIIIVLIQIEKILNILTISKIRWHFWA